MLPYLALVGYGTSTDDIGLKWKHATLSKWYDNIPQDLVKADLPSKAPPATAVLGRQRGLCTHVVAWCEAPQLAGRREVSEMI